ncbi:hypothetical protein GGS20DRAFT_43413 [Poronia punctata]|nr:hypothetical protein GGS20DRAFT_43413 [Poronia punctata]
MPAKTSKNGVAATQTTPIKRFELPALDLKFGSLTEGTDIPPPPPSPKQEQPLPQIKTPAKEDAPEQTEEKPKPKPEETKPKEANGTANGTTPGKPDMTIHTNIALKRSAEEVPLSPVPSSRGSIRRLISKTLLNHAYDDQGPTTGHLYSRPPSRTASLLADEKKAKRSSGWFRRLRAHDNAALEHNNNNNKAPSIRFEEVSTKPAGPPPPMIPELSALETKVDTKIGDDLFKSIGRDF